MEVEKRERERKNERDGGGEEYLHEGTKPSSGGREFIASRRGEIEREDWPEEAGGSGPHRGIGDTGGAWQCVAYYTFLLFIILHKYRPHLWGCVLLLERGTGGNGGAEMIYRDLELVSPISGVFFCVLIRIRVLIYQVSHKSCTLSFVDRAARSLNKSSDCLLFLNYFGVIIIPAALFYSISRHFLRLKIEFRILFSHLFNDLYIIEHFESTC